MRNRYSCCLLVALFVAIATKKSALAQKISQPSPYTALNDMQSCNDNTEMLKHRLEMMEAKHDTLEAATEQFRLQAKSSREKLNEEKLRYDELVLSKIDTEKRHQDEIASQQSRFLEAENEILANEIEIARLNEKLEHALIEISTLQFSLSERDQEMIASKAENIHLRQQLTMLKSLVEDLERKSVLTRLWHVLRESEFGSTIVELAEENWDWLKDNGSYLIERLSSLFATFHKYCIAWFGRTTEHVHGTSKHMQAFIRGVTFESLRENWVSLIRKATIMLGSLWSVATNLWQHCWVRFPLASLTNNHTIVRLERFLSRLVVAHKATAVSLEWSAVVIASFHVTNLAGSRSHWLYRTCMTAKAHSSLILVLLDVALGFLLLEMGLIGFRKAYNRLIGARRQGSFHKSVLLSSAGTTPTTSLLRTAGGLSLRSSRSESDSLSGGSGAFSWSES